jgi:hypothetical protein
LRKNLLIFFEAITGALEGAPGRFLDLRAIDMRREFDLGHSAHFCDQRFDLLPGQLLAHFVNSARAFFDEVVSFSRMA